MNSLNSLNSLKKGEVVPLLNFVENPGIPLLNFEGGSRGPGSQDPGPIFTPCRCFSRFSRSRFFRVQVFQSPGFSWSSFFRIQDFQGPDFLGSRFFWVQVQGRGPGSGSRF